MAKYIKDYTLKGLTKTRIYDAEIPLYDIPFTIYIADTMKKAANAADKEFGGATFQDDISPATVAYACRLQHPKHGPAFLMLLNTSHVGDKTLASTIAHEALHLSWFVCDTVGINPTWEEHEAQAYILQHITDVSQAALVHYAKKHKIKINI